MSASDQVIHRFSIYEIKRHTGNPHDFRWTNFYENYSDFLELHPEIQPELTENELIICSTVVDADNYTVLTTRRIITKENSIENIGNMTGAIHNTPPLQFKLEQYNYVSATLQLQNGSVFNYFMEAGGSSMVMYYGIRTLIWSQQLTDLQMISLMRIWDRKKVNLQK